MRPSTTVARGAEGTITGLIGPNGSGKTTMFNIITGYLRADAGAVALRRPRRHRARHRAALPARAVADVPAGAGVPAADRAGEPRGGRRLPAGGSCSAAASARADRERAEQLLGRVPASPRSPTLPAAELSYGQRKLLEFAAVLMSAPRLVLLDEPTAGVNPVMIETMERHIRERHAAGITFLVVEHDMTFVMRLCDPVVVLDAGRPIFAGPPAEVQPNPLVLDAYLGGSVADGPRSLCSSTGWSPGTAPATSSRAST